MIRLIAGDDSTPWRHVQPILDGQPVSWVVIAILRDGPSASTLIVERVDETLHPTGEFTQLSGVVMLRPHPGTSAMIHVRWPDIVPFLLPEDPQ